MHEIEDWIFENYDTDKNGKLSQNEAKKLLSDVQSYDFGSETLVPVEDLDAWFAKFDTNKDGDLSIDEAFKALQWRLLASLTKLSDWWVLS